MSTESSQLPWELLRQMIALGDADLLAAFLDRLGPAEMARAISRLDHDDRNRLFILLNPAEAADVIEDVSDAQALDLIDQLPPDQAAAIVDELESDRQADLLGELDDDDAAAILDRMAPAEAEHTRQLLNYSPDTAGGIMVTEYVAYRHDQSVTQVLSDLQANHKQYADYDVQYVYVTDASGNLVGVLRMRDLLFTPPATPLDEVMIKKPLYVRSDAPLDELQHFFDHHHLFGVSVVDEQGRLVGVVQQAALEEASTKRADRQFLDVSGIIGGEEFRSMPLWHRCRRRMSWLSINIVLNMIAAAVIAVHQETLQAAIVLAVFLPMISDMSGCSGNQAIAVSIRELTLGLIRPHELLRVLAKEAGVGLLNGLALGLVLGGLAMLWNGNLFLGLVVGSALAANTVVSVLLGGVLPLILKSRRLDPALVSGPILTTITDMCGFLMVLSFAQAVLPHLSS